MQNRHVFLSPEAHDYMIYGNNANSQMEYLQAQMSMMSNFGSSVSSRLMQIAENSYDYITDYISNFDITQELQNLGLLQSVNEILPLVTLEQLQNANPLMMRYIMAEPTTRQNFLDGNIYGYGDQYNNFTQSLSDGVGDDDYDYRRVMNGVFVLNEGDEDTYYRKHYFEDLVEGDRPLTIDESLAIQETWLWQKHYALMNEIDFTKPGGPNANRKA